MGVVITSYTGGILDLEGGKPFKLCFCVGDMAMDRA